MPFNGSMEPGVQVFFLVRAMGSPLFHVKLAKARRKWWEVGNPYMLPFIGFKCVYHRHKQLVQCHGLLPHDSPKVNILLQDLGFCFGQGRKIIQQVAIGIL